MAQVSGSAGAYTGHNVVLGGGLSLYPPLFEAEQRAGKPIHPLHAFRGLGQFCDSEGGPGAKALLSSWALICEAKASRSLRKDRRELFISLRGLDPRCGYPARAPSEYLRIH